MDDLINELAEQCYEHDHSWTGVGQRTFNKEKFARLIAAECARICYDEDFVSGSGYAREITKRFGVNE